MQIRTKIRAAAASIEEEKLGFKITEIGCHSLCSGSVPSKSANYYYSPDRMMEKHSIYEIYQRTGRLLHQQLF
jgi:hypothetical protein